jgi:diaminopimelate decarboxylase
MSQNNVMTQMIEQPIVQGGFVDRKEALELVRQHGSPLFVYSREDLLERVKQLLSVSLPFGHTIRYAIKANPHPKIVQLFADSGLYFDASSSYEVSELLAHGIEGSKISLSSQQPAHNLSELIAAGVQYVATSMHQLELFAEIAPAGGKVALRVNPGMGAGHNNRTSTGGINSSFGLWYEYLADALRFAQDKGLVIDRVHIHVGSGADPSIWGTVMDKALDIVRMMPDVVTLDIGGGYKISRDLNEPEADMAQITSVFSERLATFASETGRKLHLELEPGTWLVGHAGILLSEVMDIVDTGRDGFSFLKVNTGMNDILRPSLYGAQHQIKVLTGKMEQIDYVVVGHNCETGDVLTPAPGNAEMFVPRTMNKADIGDYIAIYDVGAYCASFSTKGYNAFPPAKEVLI